MLKFCHVEQNSHDTSWCETCTHTNITPCIHLSDQHLQHNIKLLFLLYEGHCHNYQLRYILQLSAAHVHRHTNIETPWCLCFTSAGVLYPFLVPQFFSVLLTRLSPSLFSQNSASSQCFQPTRAPLSGLLYWICSGTSNTPLEHLPLTPQSLPFLFFDWLIHKDDISLFYYSFTLPSSPSVGYSLGALSSSPFPCPTLHFSLSSVPLFFFYLTWVVSLLNSYNIVQLKSQMNSTYWNNNNKIKIQKYGILLSECVQKSFLIVSSNGFYGKMTAKTLLCQILMKFKGSFLFLSMSKYFGFAHLVYLYHSIK